MGIPRFAYFISNRYPLIIKKIREEYDVPEIDNLYLDINGIIHNVSHNYYCDASQINETTKKIYFDVCEVIKGIMHLIKPKRLLMISADGVAPRAKMNQQRIRRFRKELDSLKNQELGETQKKINEDIAEEEKIIFDSNAISAGTKFMFNLTTYMKEYIINEKKTNKEWSNIEVILTGSDVPGEGEHKILEYIRNYKSSNKYHPYTKHCIYGLDADLIMLSLISHETNFIILREDTFKIRKKEKMEKKGIEVINTNKKFNNDNYIVNNTPYEFLLISVLREYLELEFGYLKNKINFKYNLEKIIDDFIFLCFFIGNDFLPNLFSFNIENGALTHLFEFYKACLPELDGYLTEKGKINIDRMKTFFNYLSKHELHSIDMLLRKNKNENKKDRMKRANETKEQIKLLKRQKIEEKKKKYYEDLKLKTKEEQNKFKKNKKEKKISIILEKFKEISNELKKEYVFKDEYEKLKNKNLNNESKIDDINPKIEDVLKEALKYNCYIEDSNYCSDIKVEDIDDSDVSDIDTNQILSEFLKSNSKDTEEEKKEIEDENDINIMFVEKMKKMKNAKEVKEFYYKEKLNIDLNTEKGKEEREKMFNLYLEGLQWILCYYYRGLKSWKWYYPYHYAPMISDYNEVNINESLYNKFDLFNNDKSEPFNPYQSLLMILPKQSFNLLPKCYRDIPNQIPEYFPEKIEIDYNGKTASYESLLLLPFVDEKLILELENKNSHLEAEEKEENKWGKTFLFLKNELNKENISPIIYEIYQNKNVDLINNYEIRKCDFSFPTLKTMDYDYQMINIKQYFGKASSITKQIAITPKMFQNINNMKIDKFLREKSIFIDYPYKRLAKIKGFVYKKFFYYLYGNIVYIDNNFRLTKELIESIRYSHQKIGIYLEHPEILCYVVKFSGYKLVKDKMIKQYDEYNPYYVPFEITSLNATSKDFEKFISHFDYEYSENQKKKKYVKNY